MRSVKGGIGGALHEVPRFVTKLSPMMQIVYDVAGTVVLAKFMKQPEVSLGFAGASVSRHMEQIFKKSLKDNLEDYDYVDPSTLSDSGFDDESGNAVVMDDEGNMYALADDGESYEPVGHIDDFELEDPLQKSALINLNDNPYALSNDPFALSNDPYALSEGDYPY
jgi:hypothetical protein